MHALTSTHIFSVPTGAQGTAALSGSGGGGVSLPAAPGYLTAASISMDKVSTGPCRVGLVYGNNAVNNTSSFAPDQIVKLTPDSWIRGDSAFGWADSVSWFGRIPLYPSGSILAAYVDNQTGGTLSFDLWYVVEIP